MDKPEPDMIETSHDRVFYHDGGDVFNRGEQDAAERVAEEFPDYGIVITMGPYRSHDVAYHVHEDEGTIRLDFYSVRPGFNRMDEVIEDIRKAVE